MENLIHCGSAKFKYKKNRCVFQWEQPAFLKIENFQSASKFEKQKHLEKSVKKETPIRARVTNTNNNQSEHG